MSVVAGANVHDYRSLAAIIRAAVVERPKPTPERPHNLCLEEACDSSRVREAVANHGYVLHIRRIGEEKLDSTGEKRYPARGWVVERTLAWLSECRALPVSSSGFEDNAGSQC